MSNLKVNVSNVLSTVSAEQIQALNPAAADGLAKLYNGNGLGSDFLGWVNLPAETPESLIADIEATAKQLRETCDYVVSVGIGGSYLGAKAVIEALSDSFATLRGAEDDRHCRVLFAGQNIGEDYLSELQDLLRDKKFGIIVISKSGTTTEPAIAFRLLKEQLESQMGKAEAAKRIVAVTDAKRGALRQLATEEGYKTYVIPDNVGGRFSVLTPVGLLPIAVAGYDIRALLDGAREMMRATEASDDTNPSFLYATTRNALYRAGKKIEILVNYNPKLHFMGEWWKQLYGESEGKNGIGIFPASVEYNADLHSMGQYIQDGPRTLMETVVSFEQPQNEFTVPFAMGDPDRLNYLAGRKLSDISHMAQEAVKAAHIAGGVPNLEVRVPKRDEAGFAWLVCFFELACAISGYMSGVNPFDQPGVEAYKKNMFSLLGKPEAN